MNTIPRTPAAEQISGGVQNPLLSADQLVPGAYLAGNTMQHVWRVVSVNLASDTIMIHKEPMPPEPQHQQHTRHRFSLHGDTTCDCGLRRQRILGQAEGRSDGILPMRENMPRVYTIVPIAPLSQPDRFTVYLTSEGDVVTANVGVWSTHLPLIPRLYPAWSLPEALRGRLP